MPKEQIELNLNILTLNSLLSSGKDFAKTYSLSYHHFYSGSCFNYYII